MFDMPLQWTSWYTSVRPSECYIDRKMRLRANNRVQLLSGDRQDYCLKQYKSFFARGFRVNLKTFIILIAILCLVLLMCWFWSALLHARAGYTIPGMCGMPVAPIKTTRYSWTYGPRTVLRVCKLFFTKCLHGDRLDVGYNGSSLIRTAQYLVTLCIYFSHYCCAQSSDFAQTTFQFVTATLQLIIV